MIKFTLSLSLILLGVFSFAQSTPKYSNEFLSIGVGARAFGMSNSLVAATDDVTSGYWNPAGLTQIEDKIQVSFMHSPYLGGIANYDYLGIGSKFKENAAIGFSLVRFGVDGIPNTFDLLRNGQLNYQRVSEFSAVDYAFIFSYAQRMLADGLTFGGSAKIIHRRAGEFTKAWGFGMDAGMQYRTDNNWMFAVMARDVTSTFNAWSFSFTDAEKDILTQTGNEIPVNSLEITLPKVILGVAKKVEFDQVSILGEFNMDINTDGRRNVLIKTDLVSIDPHMGFEAAYNNKIYLRAGVGNFQEVIRDSTSTQWTFQPNIGIGLKLKNLTLDYALSDIGDVSTALYSNVFSIKLAVNPSSRD